MEELKSKKVDLIFAPSSQDLLDNVKQHLKDQNLKIFSMSIIKEYNNFCAVVTSESKYIGMKS